MFNYDELDALANNAKAKLKEQSNVNTEETEAVDLYEGLFDDNISIENNVAINKEDEVNFNELYNLSNSEYSEPEVNHELRQYDELLFPGGPSKIDLDTWKKDWEGYDIYITEILNQTFIFRTLNRYEYKQLITLQNVDALQREEVICQTVTLWPQNYTWKEMATTLAGIPSTYAEIIMEKSGFTKDFAIQVL